MTELRKYGDPDYGPYGYGWCNPALYAQEPVSNEVYLATIPESDPWYGAIVAGVARLDEEFPGWKIRQIKEKFGELRFYAVCPEGSDPEKFFEACYRIEDEAGAL